MPASGKPDEIESARLDLEAAYQFFNWATDPRAISEAVHRIQAALIRLDALTHPGESAPQAPLPWLGAHQTPSRDEARGGRSR